MKNSGRDLNDELHHLLNWKIILCSSSSSHCRWPEGVQHREEVSRNTKGQTPIKHPVKEPAVPKLFFSQGCIVRYFCVQTHLYLMSSRNSRTGFKELRSTPAFLSQWKFFITPSLLWFIKLFAVIIRQFLIFQRNQRQRGFKQYLKLSRRTNCRTQMMSFS